MSESDKANQYRVWQQVVQGTKRRFDVVEYTESSNRARGQERRARDQMVPWWLFHHYKVQSGTQLSDIQREWKDAVEGRGAEPEWDDDHKEWTVGLWMGTVRDRVISDMQTQSCSRTAAILSTQQLDDLRRGGESMLPQYVSQMRAPLSLGSSSMAPVGAPQVDATSNDQPSLPPPADIAMAAVTREVNFTCFVFV